MAEKGFKLLPWHVRDVIVYVRAFGQLLNLRYPATFNEKTLCRKHHDCYSNPLFPLLADKYQVRGYVKAKVGAQNLIPLVLCAEQCQRTGCCAA